MARLRLIPAIFAVLVPLYSAAQTAQGLPTPGAPTQVSIELKPAKAADGKWGFQDKSGVYRIPPKFHFAHGFSEGLALVYTTSGTHILGTEGWDLFRRVGYIDSTGRFVIEPRFAEGAADFSEGLAAFSPGVIYPGDGKWGYLDKSGKWTVKPQFNSASQFSEGLAAVALYKDGEEQWGFIDSTGIFQIPVQFWGARPFRNGIAVVSVRDRESRAGQHMHIPEYRCIDKKGAFVACR
jgi:hypothetical protein